MKGTDCGETANRQTLVLFIDPIVMTARDSRDIQVDNGRQTLS